MTDKDRTRPFTCIDCGAHPSDGTGAVVHRMDEGWLCEDCGGHAKDQETQDLTDTLREAQRND